MNFFKTDSAGLKARAQILKSCCFAASAAGAWEDHISHAPFITPIVMLVQHGHLLADLSELGAQSVLIYYSEAAWKVPENYPPNFLNKHGYLLKEPFAAQTGRFTSKLAGQCVGKKATICPSQCFKPESYISWNLKSDI